MPEETVTISHEFTTEMREIIEDSVAYVIAEFASRGELVSGETAYKVLECLALAKQAEFMGLVD